MSRALAEDKRIVKDYLIRIPIKEYKNIKKNDQIVLTCWSEENEMKYKLELDVTPNQ